MPTAYNTLRQSLGTDRVHAVAAGLLALGYTVHNSDDRSGPMAAGDVLVTWNLHGDRWKWRDRARAAGATCIVIEEAYTRALLKPGEQRLSAALWKHHDGIVPSPDAERWAARGIGMKPWRTTGKHVLVCGQRGIGEPSAASPDGWHDSAAARIRGLTDRPVIVRSHPGKDKDLRRTLPEQLRNCWCCVVWSSNCAVEALLAGVPVIYEAPHTIWEQACGHDLIAIESPWMGPREVAFARLASAEWDISEIASGAAFRKLLSCN